jgi:hypothetical protein
VINGGPGVYLMFSFAPAVVIRAVSAFGAEADSEPSFCVTWFLVLRHVVREGRVR